MIDSKAKDIKWMKKHQWAGGNYSWIKDSIDPKILSIDISDKLILEIGSRDCLDSCYFVRQFNPKKVFTFEPSRPGIERCIQVLRHYHQEATSIILCGHALGSKNEIRTFYEFTYQDPLENNQVNIGASSLYKWTSINHPDNSKHKNLEKKSNVQKTYDVLVMKGDDLKFLENEQIYLIAMDVEGYEFEVLNGLKNTLKRTRFICLETGFNFPREKQKHNALDVMEFMVEQGFNLKLCNITNSKELPKNDGNFQQFNLLFEKN